MRERGEIIWTANQISNLRKAVNNFNRKVKRLKQNEENLDIIPETINFRDLKNDIKTSAELRRRINILKRFTRRGAEKLAEGTAERMTFWEKNERIINKRVATRVLRQEYNQLVKQNINSPFKDVTKMSSRAREIVSTLSNLENIFKKTGQSYERMSSLLKKLGRSDRAFLQASRYKQYYLRELEKYSNYSMYESVVNKIRQTPVLELYDKLGFNINLQDLIYVSDTTLSEDEFNNFYGEFLENDITENERNSVELFYVYNEKNIIVNYFESFEEAQFFVNKQKNKKYKIKQERTYV